ncbi:MAG: metallophosphoesterase [Bacteroidales bacterium]|nr:metallophosphoesterase [Bacteroidales bacterium]MCF8456418.1 metallophosphoesterase [Bacteroidales bacterium]
MTIQYASDLHLEFPENKVFLKANPLLPKGNVLLLAGDIVPFVVLDKHKDFFSYVSDNFQTTYWIPGNHEYYYYDISAKCGTFNENIRSNVHLINNLTVHLNAIRFIFSTLWSKINISNQWLIERSISDFQVIKNKGDRFSAEHFNQQHDENLYFVKQELHKNYKGKTVVVTHHVPTFLNYPEQYIGDVLNEAFGVELFDLIETNEPNLWIYGHHHSNTPDFLIGKTQMLTNQLGYVQYNENKNFNNNATYCL